MSSRPVPSPHRRPRRYTQGAALIVVVLFTLLVLSMILAATLRLSLSTRVNGTDQKTILQTQYAAESNLALARSRLRDIQNVLSGKDKDGGDTGYMSLPTTTRSTDMEAWALQFCNQTSSAWINDPDNTLGSGSSGSTQLCTANGTTAQSYNILGNLITNTGYATLPSNDNPPATTSSVATKTAWWYNYLNNTASSNGIVLTVVPEKVVKLGYSYRFYVRPSSVTTSSPSTSKGFRTLAAYGTLSSDWWFQIDIPNPFDNALFMNQWLEGDGGFVADKIKGNLFTNEKVRFLYSTNTVQFMGDVNSAGCTTLSSSTPAPGADCTKQAGFYGPYNTTPITQANSVATATANAALRSRMISQGATIGANNATNFRAKYTSLPLDGSTQQAAATASGITAASNAAKLYLYAGDNSGNPLTSYNSATTSWNEPSPTYQYIQYSTGAGTVLTTYRIASDGTMYKNTGTIAAPIWTNQNKTFNGVLYSDHLLTVNGPGRTTATGPGDVSKMPPALASFSTINVTAAGGLNLASDLTTSNTPCGYDNTWYTPSGTVAQPGCPKTPPPGNMLALFAPSGDISIYPSFAKEATYHAAILASQGTFKVTNYNSGTSMGNRHVVGAVVENHYGLNAIANGGVQQSGYRDDFSQDIRLKNTDAIPFNPIVASGNWSYTNSSTVIGNNNYKALDSLIWQQGKQ